MWDMVTGEGEALLLADLICHRCRQERSKNDKKRRKKKTFLAQTSMFGHTNAVRNAVIFISTTVAHSHSQT